MTDEKFVQLNRFGRVYHRLASRLTRLVSPLKRLGEALRRGGVSGIAAIVLSFLLPGLGRVLQKKPEKGLLTAAAGALYLWLMFAAGFGWLTGAAVSAVLSLRAAAVVLTLIVLLVYLYGLSGTVADVLARADGTPYRCSAPGAAVCGAGKNTAAFFRRAAGLRGGYGALMLLAFPVFGAVQMVTKQAVRGLIFLGLQILYIVYMAQRGAADIRNLIALKTGLPSTFNIVYGLLAVFVSLLFVWLFFANLRNALGNLETVSAGGRPRGIREEAASYLKEGFYKTLLIVPVTGVLAFTVLPLVFMIGIAFTGYNSADTSFGWTGLESFKNLVLLEGQLRTLLSVTSWTLVWAFFATFTNYFFGILLAVLINKKAVRFKAMWRTVFIVTMATPQFVSLLVMRQLFAENGLVNLVLTRMNLITQNINFWGDVTNARILIIAVNMWVGIPYLMMLTSGILQNIPEDLYESARIEGAGKFKQFAYITMPYMFFMTTPLIITQFVGNINNFNVIFLLTGGLPYGVGLENAGGTDILITWLYKLTKTHRQYNLSAAVGIVIFLLSAGISLLVYRRTSSYKREGDFA